MSANTYRIYVACLAAYNAGKLHGEWFDLEDYTDADDLQEAIAARVLRTSPCPNVVVDIDCPTCEGAGSLNNENYGTTCPDCKGTGVKSVPSSEEWAVHDYDGDIFKDCGEHPNFEKLFEAMEMAEKHGDAWLAFKNYFGDSATVDNFEDANRGAYDSFEAFVEEWCCEAYGWKGDEPFFSWIDWERAARDFEGDYTYTEGYVFDSSF
ncbi:antirestriction protein ArdA [Pseudomonas sp. P8_250]|uniref:antirestriction protein ArdA n=1 Tax=Pseudomonas sp. P8_250 TaxID=3043446 RepID=UPI002A3694C7|nr:antirestriction protein ArdA [Pseudomonas sp. P8_250]MDX9668736.1 antirestriction protein ArdA [Pseudomonas sp. P8_250]